MLYQDFRHSIQEIPVPFDVVEASYSSNHEIIRPKTQLFTATGYLFRLHRRSRFDAVIDHPDSRIRDTDVFDNKSLQIFRNSH
jgi:hypothetical protein